MIEFILIVGLIFVLGMMVLLHIGATVELPWLRDITDIPPDPSLHPWFLTAEVVVLCSIIYIIQHM